MSEQDPSTSNEVTPRSARRRGVGKGSKFMVLGRDNMRELFNAPTSNRMNFVLTFLLLLAGTGADHRHTKWSAKACEQKLGIGRPRATTAIVELAQAGLLGIADTHTAAKPHYVLRPPSEGLDEIFLPIQLVTGFGEDTPVLRRVRESGDVTALRILLGLYGSVQLDGTYGASIEQFRTDFSEAGDAAKSVFDRGIYRLWSLSWPDISRASPDWVASILGVSNPTQSMMNNFWESFQKLSNVGAVKLQNWVFESEEITAEPLFPVDRYRLFEGESDAQVELMQAIYFASHSFLGDEAYIYDRHQGNLLLPLPSHFATPHIRGVLTPTVTPDSPGHRRSYALCMKSLNHFAAEYSLCAKSFSRGIHSQPLRTMPSLGEGDGQQDPL